jgi:predicted kinase
MPGDGVSGRPLTPRDGRASAITRRTFGNHNRTFFPMLPCRVGKCYSIFAFLKSRRFMGNLIIVCGVPGSGKSTFALHAAERWGALRFASETFAEELGAAARDDSGDLSREAIVHAYSAMGAAAKDALETHTLVVAVGSFRSEDQRKRFREIAKMSNAATTTLRIVCRLETAAERVRSRIRLGERGPSLSTIREIDNELNLAADIELALANDASVESFHGQIDTVFASLR